MTESDQRAVLFRGLPLLSLDFARVGDLESLTLGECRMEAIQWIKLHFSFGSQCTGRVERGMLAVTSGVLGQAREASWERLEGVFTGHVIQLWDWKILRTSS